ncbi:MAG: hypothetical protein ACR2HS_06765 [Gammaproteobacteria bacterium]
MKSSHNFPIVHLTPLKKAYSVGDRSIVLTEIKKLGLVKNQVSFYSAWWRHGKSNIKSSTIEYKKETLQYLKAFFIWYFSNPSQTHFTDDMLNKAWDMFLILAQQIDVLHKWGHRNYPTPLELIPEDPPHNMNGCFNKILNYISTRQEAQKFTIEELFHLSLHATQKLNNMKIKQKKLQEIIEKMILWLSDFSGVNLDRGFNLASELSFYYRQANPTTTFHEIIANKSSRYDQHGNKIPIIFTD